MISSEYAAGFFDGEGSIGIRRERNIYRLEVNATQTTAEVLIAFQEKYGGKVTKRNKEKSRDLYMWRVYTQNADAFLKDVLPFLIVKQERAKLALEFRASHYGHAYGNAKAVAGTAIGEFRKTCFAKMKKLNQRGLVTN